MSGAGPLLRADRRDRVERLRKHGFPDKAETAPTITTVIGEADHPPASIFDFVQRITAVARVNTYQVFGSASGAGQHA